MAMLDLFRLKKSVSPKLYGHKISADLIALNIGVNDWLNDKHSIFVGESGTLYRFFQFAIWKYNLDKSLCCRGTLLNREITKDKNIVNLSQEELLKLDNGTSQWASAAALFGDIHRVDDPPNKLALTYDVLDGWTENWKPVMDETIYNQAIYFYNVMGGIEMYWKPSQSEDFCFAYAFNKITKEEGLKRWPALQSHESNRIVEMEKNLDCMMNGRPIISKDHRIVQALVMLAKVKNRPIQVTYPTCVLKSWPLFWSFMDNF